ncbi:type II toxin-antitoxin system RelE/ParE family toxin [Bradyrhizobium sp. SZCCHNR1098]|uniref:type II toxin-antitoxin system RelE/ParE family toxin n=1 Tax=Bradyrhizobium sp. SZCCHNR1098 TaxID=3057370 RepID=UPI002915DC53|nr:type II toxin-antitoxin system RelE/ParE family toxin [Bradyrhizobium sp. SZCCHNR1098]
MKLRFTTRAANELESVLDYVASHSPGGARRVHMRIKSVFDMLVYYPKAGAQSTHPRLRRLTINPYPYLIYYEVAADEVVIHSVRHTARNPDEFG